MQNTLEILKDLIRIPSVNPMGREVSGDIYYEGRMTEHLQKWCEGLGLSFEREEVHTGRENLYALLPGTVSLEDGGPLIVWEVHQDTVPIEGMTIDPFEPNIAEGKIYGRGACDIKGGMAAMMAAIEALKKSPPPTMPNIVIAFAVNEEHGFTGATALARQFQSGQSKFFPRIPDAVVVAEPTDLNVVVAHKGAVRWRLETQGKAAHSSDPSRGKNAVYDMARVVSELEKIATAEVPAAGSHPRLGSPTLSVGLIQGGISVNTVPDRCMIEVDRRLLPGESATEAMNFIVSLLNERLPGDTALTHHEPFIATMGLSDENNHELAKRLTGAVEKFNRNSELVGAPYGTDASVLSATGAPAVVFGPGSIHQAHTHNEWLDITELELAAKILVQFVVDWK